MVDLWSINDDSTDNYYDAVKGTDTDYVTEVAPNDWKNTKDANGQGGDGNAATDSTRFKRGGSGGTGGNNRNAIRGTGSAGGGSRAKGGDGVVTIYKIF